MSRRSARAGRAMVRATENFARNLEDIAAFLEVERSGPFGALEKLLFIEVIPNLEGFPRLGTDFRARRPGSARGIALARELRRRLGKAAEIRQYVAGDYLILYSYAVATRAVSLLSIRHHRQLSFDLSSAWLQ